ncbi:hypothetical protein XELAEV_18047914mg [Xenopus laevis]|uniref:Taste receptor type 2 n=1 Tax=Xenopus laevis TaxID=8355 RepID=A0A974BVP7_XENLA|nr:hypothetical protein XELAEV_18047914mg [Xenopus laevis]
MDLVTCYNWNNYSTDQPVDAVVGKDTKISPILFIFISCVGMLTNMFIMSTNFHSWMKGQNLNPSDLFIVALAFSNLVFPVSTGVWTIYFQFTTREVFKDYHFYVYNSAMVYALFCNSWLSACLCFFSFVKVSNFKPGFLARLKSKINTLVPRLILGAQVFSILNSLFYMLTFFETSSTTGDRIDTFYNIFFLLLSCYIPFLIIVVTTSLIITSLYKHTRHMQQNMGEFGGPSLKSHQRAARTMASFLIIYVFFCGLSLGSSIFLNKQLLDMVNYSTY